MSIVSVTLCLVYSIYLLVGSVMFTFLEYEIKREIVTTLHPTWNRLKEIVIYEEAPNKNDELTRLIEWVQNECDSIPLQFYFNITSVGNQSQLIADFEANCTLLKESVIDVTYEYPWTLIDSLYFSMTVITTIGYGNISPSTKEGKIACILYSLIGIPLTLVLLARTSSFFGKSLYNLFASKVDAAKQKSKFFIAMGAFFYISLGFVIFIFLPAVLFMYTEEWTYIDSVYYAYITLTTIGFGDFVTGNNMEDPWLTVYQIGVILWIISGLGYWVMVANFMVLALKSKKVYAMARRITELKKIVSQLNVNQSDPEFLTKSSKPTLNFLMQLGSVLAVPEMSTVPEIGNVPAASSSENPRKIRNPAVNRPTLPGIAALFNQSRSSGLPLFQTVLQAGKSQPSATSKNEENTELNIENIKKESIVSSDSKLVACSMNPNSQLSTPSECYSENDISSYSFLSEVETQSNSEHSQDNPSSPDNVDEYVSETYSSKL